MNANQQTPCSCAACPGTGCLCGCQQAAAQTAAQGVCGAQCACGPQCQCDTSCRCGAGANCAQA